MKDIYKSISLDDGKITLTEHNGIDCIQKVTNEKEIENMTLISEHLKGLNRVFLDGMGYTITTPRILEWNPNTGFLKLELKNGNNLEEVLENASAGRSKDISFIKEFFGWMESSGTFWRGAAPRHIIINKPQKEISLLDFERPVTIKKGGFGGAEFQLRLRGLVHEEFCAFLYDNEQLDLFPHIWDHDKDEQIEVGSIFGKRVNLLIKHFFAPKEEIIPIEQLLFIYKIMSSVVTPFLIEGRPFYPILALDNIARDPEEYVNVVTNLIKIDRQKWPQYLKHENF